MSHSHIYTKINNSQNSYAINICALLHGPQRPQTPICGPDCTWSDNNHYNDWWMILKLNTKADRTDSLFSKSLAHDTTRTAKILNRKISLCLMYVNDQYIDIVEYVKSMPVLLLYA